MTVLIHKQASLSTLDAAQAKFQLAKIIESSLCDNLQGKDKEKHNL